MLDALGPAQQLILAQSGTLTTLVMTVIARLATPLPRDGPHLGESSSLGKETPFGATDSASSTPRVEWAAMTVTIGDSAAYVYRRRLRRVEELTYAAHAGAYRDPRFTPGALGFALGKEPDLGNLSCTLTLMDTGREAPVWSSLT